VKITIYSDGSCLGNPGVGGYASLIIRGEEKFWVAGNQKETTNNQMELLALICALEYVEKNNLQYSEINIYTDSKYVQLGISQWIHNWVKNGWKRGKSKILNLELWQRLFLLKNKIPFNIYWVKAHADDELNILVDYHARFMANKLLMEA
jgi:ribonuclease HI